MRVSVPRARLFDENGGARPWRNQTLPVFKRLTKRAVAVIASSYLSAASIAALVAMK